MQESLPIIEEALAYGAENSIPPTFCPVEYWLTTPHFAQVAADTYRRPIAVYTDNINTKPNSDDFVLEPLIYVPFQGPLSTDKEPIPIIIQFFNSNHWVLYPTYNDLINTVIYYYQYLKAPLLIMAYWHFGRIRKSASFNRSF